MNSYDIDGVIYMGKGVVGLTPLYGDVIVTGRSFDELPETNTMLIERGIMNRVYFNPLPFDQKTRKSSGEHKAKVLSELVKGGAKIDFHFEDDPVQIEEINKANIPGLRVIAISHGGVVNLENERHL